jgi:hypothetical protein
VRSRQRLGDRTHDHLVLSSWKGKRREAAIEIGAE